MLSVIVPLLFRFALKWILDAYALGDKIQYAFVTSQAIHFGTSGWRGIIADDFTFSGVRRAAAAIAGHVPEKDGILACLLVAETIATRQASLADQLRDLFRRVGREFWQVRLNLQLPEDVQAKLSGCLKADFKEFAGRHVKHTNRTDGLKLVLDDDTWLLMRPSGTEPIVRIYTEAATLAEAQKLAGAARAWIAQ